jgi:hypothetical protein
LTVFGQLSRFSPAKNIREVADIAGKLIAAQRLATKNPYLKAGFNLTRGVLLCRARPHQCLRALIARHLLWRAYCSNAGQQKIGMLNLLIEIRSRLRCSGECHYKA